jgi:integrase
MGSRFVFAAIVSALICLAFPASATVYNVNIFGPLPDGVTSGPTGTASTNACSATTCAGGWNTAYSVLARVLSVAKDRGLISTNVCERGGRLYEADRAEIIWEAEHIKAFCGAASPELQFALLLALWTGQRQGTLISIAWSQYDGTHIRLQPNKQRHGKKKKRIVVPVGAPLKVALDARRPENAEGTILRNTYGEPWTSDGFRSSWGTAFDRAKLGDADLHFHDLRGTAVTRLALSGCTTPQIAAITAHSPRDVDEILKAHYLGGQAELAEQAIVKLVAQFG